MTNTMRWPTSAPSAGITPSRFSGSVALGERPPSQPGCPELPRVMWLLARTYSSRRPIVVHLAPNSEARCTTVLIEEPALVGSGPDAVPEVHDSVADPTFVQQLEVGARRARKRGLPCADEDGTDQQLALIDEPRVERLRCEVGAADGEIAGGRRLHLAHRDGVEAALESR